MDYGMANDMTYNHTVFILAIFMKMICLLFCSYLFSCKEDNHDFFNFEDIEISTQDTYMDYSSMDQAVHFYRHQAQIFQLNLAF